MAPETVPCARCGVPCTLGASAPRVDYTQVVLVAATTPRGMCGTCAVHWWLHSVDGLRWSLERGPGVLAEPSVQSVLQPLLTQQHPDLAALDWARLLAQWDLPWPDDWALPEDRHA